MEKEWGKKASEYNEERGSAGDGKYFRRFKEPSTQVRFLIEPDDMIAFKEHYDQALEISYPCSEEKNCPGCLSPNERTRKASARYGTFAALTAREDQLVVPFKMGYTVWEKLSDQAKWTGTIRNMDTIVTKTGSMLNTEYDTEPGEKYEIDIAAKLAEGVERYGRLRELVGHAWVEAWGEDINNPVPQARANPIFTGETLAESTAAQPEEPPF